MNEEQSIAARLSEIFNEAKLLPSGAERQQFLAKMCGDDAKLRADLEQLLRAAEDASRFLQPGSGVSPEFEAQFAALKPEEGGDHIGHYKLLQQIGEGGFGVVWMAEQTEPVKRRVALKIIKLGMDTKEVIARFEQERQALAMMDHPNIARVLDAGATPTGRPYFVMELVRGIKITEYCDQANLTTAERLPLFIAVCNAVQHAHQKGIIHRDLKPSNILVTLHDGVPVPKVIDFGVAKATQSQRLTDLTLFTQFEQMIGTPLYMSPEQAEMSGLDIDTRSDIYSLGVLLYELLVGRTPFDPQRFLKAGYDEMRRLIREEDPPKPSTALSTMQFEMRSTVARHRHSEAATIARLLRGDLDWIVMKALEKDRTRRYETASGFAADVQRYLADEPVAACPPSAVYRLRKFGRRNKGALAVAALVLLSLVLAGSGVGWALRDRMARHAQVAGQVTSILAKVTDLEGEQKWPEALVAARQAEAVATASGADAATERRVHDRLKDLEFINRLEQIRMQQATWIEGKFDSAGAGREYARAFRDYGVDVDESTPEKSAEHFKGRTQFAIPVAAAMDVWAAIRMHSKTKPTASQLATLARAIDPEPLRDRLRSTWGKRASELGDEVRRMAESVDIRAQHPATIALLVGKLRRAKLPDLALRLLRDAQSEYPADFWLNYSLAHGLDKQQDFEGAVRFYTAAVSIRPNAVAALNNLGNVLAQQGKPGEATTAYRKAIEIDPKFAYGYNGLGNALNALGKLDEALAAYRRATELNPADARHHANLGAVLAKQDKLDAAVAAFRKAVELDPKDANTHNDLGHALFDQKKPDEAIVCFRKVIELDPKHAGAHSRLGWALQGENKLDEAIVAYRKSVELDPKNAPAHRLLGMALAKQNKLDEAITAYRRAIELEPGFADGYYILGNALKRQKKMDDAIAAYRKAIELDPKNGMSYNNLGNALKALGKLDEAVAAHRKAIELDPKNAIAYTNLANGLRSQKKVDEAIAAYRKAIELNPKGTTVYNDLGSALFEQGKFDEAVAAFRKAIEIDPKNAQAHFNLGHVLHFLKKLDEAVAAYQSAAEIDPSNQDVYVNLAAALQAQGKMDEAILTLSSAIKANPNDASAYRNIAGLLCCAMKDHGGAVAWLRKAIELDPKDAQAQAQLGCALSGDGKTREAIAAYETAATLDPQLAGSHNGLAWIFATCADPALRDHSRAVDLAKKAVELAPEEGVHLSTLGAACYRAGDWKAALGALEKSMKLRNGGDSNDWFFVAMAHWQLGHKDEARQWQAKAIEWMEKNAPTDAELIRFRAEAAELLGVKANSGPEPIPK